MTKGAWTVLGFETPEAHHRMRVTQTAKRPPGFEHSGRLCDGGPHVIDVHQRVVCDEEVERAGLER